MKTTKSMLFALLLLAGLAWQPVAAADDEASAPAAAASAPAPAGGQGTKYTAKGADTCLDCHDAESDTATFTAAGIFKSKHGQRGNAKAPFGPGGLQCEACHGPGGKHAEKSSKKTATINSFKPDSFYSVQYRNDACLTCHQGRSRNAWHAGAHDRAQLACTDCHRIHTGSDAVLAKASQADVCYRCHKQQRADFYKTSAHPVRYQRMVCSDCHNPHGTTNPAMLIKSTLNQTCYTCHAEKRGPLLWEHAPVAEDCSLCHAAHGAVRPALLTKTPPLLCQQCHSPAGHPSVPRTAGSLPGGSTGPSIFLLAGSCTNCHSQVHGSNHPAGAKLMR
jgi:DmsE family decaheme c-type cytochrome